MPTGVVVLLGVLPAAAAIGGAARSATESRFSSAGGSTVDVVTVARQALHEAVAAQHTSQWTVSANTTAQLTLSPYALFVPLPSGKDQLYAMLDAEIAGLDGGRGWSVRYFARAPGEYTIEGTDGWMVQNRFAEGIYTALRRTLQVCIDDTESKLLGGKKIKAKGRFPPWGREMTWPVIVVQEDSTVVVGRLVVSDMTHILAGTHVLDRADFIFTDADFEDPRR